MLPESRLGAAKQGLLRAVTAAGRLIGGAAAVAAAGAALFATVRWAPQWSGAVWSVLNTAPGWAAVGGAAGLPILGTAFRFDTTPPLLATAAAAAGTGVAALAGDPGVTTILGSAAAALVGGSLTEGLITGRFLDEVEEAAGRVLG